MIAEASTTREQRQQRERRRSAARQKTYEALRDEMVARRRLPTDGSRKAPVAPPPSAPAAPAPPRVLVVPNAIAGKPPVVRKAEFTFADVLRTFDAPYRSLHAADLTVRQDKVLREMLACYTPVMGTHEWTCGDCGTVVTLPNGCNNRHCCTCGYAKRRRWAEAACSQILPVEYCHLILTVPQLITQLAMINQGVLYSMVMRIGARAVVACGLKLFQVELALLSLLHSWGQLVNDPRG